MKKKLSLSSYFIEQNGRKKLKDIEIKECNTWDCLLITRYHKVLPVFHELNDFFTSFPYDDRLRMQNWLRTWNKIEKIRKSDSEISNLSTYLERDGIWGCWLTYRDMRKNWEIEKLNSLSIEIYRIQSHLLTEENKWVLFYFNGIILNIFTIFHFKCRNFIENFSLHPLGHVFKKYFLLSLFVNVKKATIVSLSSSFAVINCFSWHFNSRVSLFFRTCEKFGF